MIKLTRPDGTSIYLSKSQIMAIIPTTVHGGNSRIVMLDGSTYDVTETPDAITALAALP
jgi:hypothetical protein